MRAPRHPATARSSSGLARPDRKARHVRAPIVRVQIRLEPRIARRRELVEAEITCLGGVYEERGRVPLPVLEEQVPGASDLQRLARMEGAPPRRRAFHGADQIRHVRKTRRRATLGEIIERGAITPEDDARGGGTVLAHVRSDLAS